MQEINITINKNAVLEEVAKTTAYIGAKSQLTDGQTLYDQVFVTDEDRKMIERFWKEACNAVTNITKRFINTVSDITHDRPVDYILNLSMSDRFNKNLTSSISASMFSMFVSYIMYKWCEIVAKDKAKEYSDNVATHIESINAKLYNKLKPQRKK